MSENTGGKESRRNFDDSLVYVNSIGGEVEIDDMGDSSDFHVRDRKLRHGEDGETSGDGDDLYGDLETAVFSSASHVKSIPRQVLEERLENALSEIEKLKERITELSRENINLQNNFSSLLKTARDDKNKNIFTLRQLREQLNYVTSLNARKQPLSKEEVERIQKYCGQVENSLQNQISMNIIRQAVESSKINSTNKPKPHTGVRWTKHYKFDNMSVYFGKEQITFTRLEPVTFPQQSADPSNIVQENTEKKSLPSGGTSLPAHVRTPDVNPPRAPLVNGADLSSKLSADATKRKHDNNVTSGREVDDSKRRKTEVEKRTDSLKASRQLTTTDQPSLNSAHSADIRSQTSTSSVPRKREASDKSRSKTKGRDSMRPEIVSDESRRKSSSTRDDSPPKKSNYHRSRRKRSHSRERSRSRSRSPHLRNRTRSSRRTLH